MFVSFAMGDHMVLLYSMIGLVMAVYVCARVSFVLPQLVPDMALYILVVFWALAFVSLMCSAYVNLGSNVSLSIFGCVFVSSGLLFM